MSVIGHENITGENLTDMLKKWPSNNSHSIYNTLIINADDVFETQLIYNDKPAPI
jgi:hypothetical protein